MANLFEAKLSQAKLSAANLSGANFLGADLFEANLTEANLFDADLSGANLRGARLIAAKLFEANLSGASLIGANLSGTNLSGANLLGADLTGANLEGAVLVRTDLRDADLTDCRVYGISTWDLNLDGAKQKDLIITPPDEPEITVDNLEVAQFIYLLLNNERIRHVIDTITSKVVLILGRFTPERKVVLDALRDELRQCDYTPVLFDVDKPASKDLTGTIQTLANMVHHRRCHRPEQRSPRAGHDGSDYSGPRPANPSGRRA